MSKALIISTAPTWEWIKNKLGKGGVGNYRPLMVSCYWTDSSIRVAFCTRHMPNDSQSQSTFAASQSKHMLKYDQPVKKPMM